ncbi:hypothetical protein ACFWVU_23055 [Streptomyces sp. NPDC058686]|uniref:hypothetical protein n=1 Tax=Streptomyces sp. NPDC058686 TaxID=3346599 RepID=UPI0036642288
MKVLRRPAYVWLPVTGAIVTYAFAALLIGPLDVEPQAAFLLGGVAIFFWALGWNSAIRSTADYVTMTNFLVTSTVAWIDVAQVTVEDGLTVTLRDGRTIGSIAFGSSLLGTFTGYRTHQRAFRLLREAHRAALRARHRKSNGPVGLDVTFEWRRLLCALVAVYGPLLIIRTLSR